MFSLVNRFHWLRVFFNKLHSNLYLIVSTYGILAIAFVALSTHWFFHANLGSIYAVSLPPAWWDKGDINHILGTNSNGQDIFDFLLIGYRSTISMTIKAVAYVVIIGAIINYTLFFIPALRATLLFLFRLLTTIPPLLSVIVVNLLVENTITNMLIIVGMTYLPRFIYNIHEQLLKENNKTYIIAYRLDGLSSFTILNRCIIPNILPTYLTEIVTLFGHIISAITTLTFLGFANDISRPDLGMMMFQMKEMMYTNYWAFLAPGLAVAITITLVYLLNIGLNSQQARN